MPGTGGARLLGGCSSGDDIIRKVGGSLTGGHRVAHYVSLVQSGGKRLTIGSGSAIVTIVWTHDRPQVRPPARIAKVYRMQGTRR
jgi:hypothetical protein